MLNPITQAKASGSTEEILNRNLSNGNSSSGSPAIEEISALGKNALETSTVHALNPIDPSRITHPSSTGQSVSDSLNSESADRDHLRIFIDGIYKGDLLNGKRHGQGKFIWPNGREYNGNWENDMMHGLGELRYEGGPKYIGNWENNLKHGKGELTYANGNRYIGNWQYNMTHGQGELKWPNGDKYIGNWENDKRQGQGELTYANGDRYIGNWENNMKSGQGELKWKNGDKYSGNWENNKAHAQGTYTFANGRIESGTWKDNKLEKKSGGKEKVSAKEPVQTKLSEAMRKKIEKEPVQNKVSEAMRKKIEKELTGESSSSDKKGKKKAKKKPKEGHGSNIAGPSSSGQPSNKPPTDQKPILKPITADNVLNGDECIICYENTKDTVLIPCGHKALCNVCVKDIKKCPLCNKTNECFQTIVPHMIDHKNCVVCDDEEINTLLIPCGHLAFCNACVVVGDECPIPGCNKVVEIVQKVFFS